MGRQRRSTRQIRCPHQEGIHRPGRLAALADGPDHQRLAAPHVTGHEDPLTAALIGRIAFRRGAGVAALVRVGPEYTGGIIEKWIDDAKSIRSEREARDLLNDIADSGVSYSVSTDFDWRDIYSHIPGFCDDLSHIDAIRAVVEENDHEYAETGFVMQDKSSGEIVYVYLIDDGELFWKSWSRSDEKEW